MVLSEVVSLAIAEMRNLIDALVDLRDNGKTEAIQIKACGLLLDFAKCHMLKGPEQGIKEIKETIQGRATNFDSVT